jgi:hypothetical protein
MTEDEAARVRDLIGLLRRWRLDDDAGYGDAIEMICHVEDQLNGLLGLAPEDDE